MKRGGSGSKPWVNKGGAQGLNFRGRPLISRPGSRVNNNDDDIPTSIDQNSFAIKTEKGCPYNFWKLYFPKQKFSESNDINKKVICMMRHFKQFQHWYELDKITCTYVLELRIDNLVEDKEMDNEWESWYQDMLTEPLESFAAVALAIHTVAEDELKKLEDYLFMKKIFVRPVGWRPVTKLVEVYEIDNQLVSVSGVVKSISPVDACVKFMCFKCQLCSTELCVQQVYKNGQITTPSGCSQGCRAKGNFLPVMCSPFTVIAPSQKILIQEVCYIKEDATRALEVDLTEEQVGSVSVGSQVIITGVVKYKDEQKNENMAKNYKPYFQCYSIQLKKAVDAELEDGTMPEIVDELRAEPNIFKILINSLCPDVFGREEAKAALVLGLLSGSDLMEVRRSNSHVLLLGNPGTGKSKLLMSAAAVSPRGMFVSGSLTSPVGLTISVSALGTIEAGALVLSDNGVCCIDELDKSGQIQMILLEAMEQQQISIAKCGACTTVPARCSILAAANPANSLYECSKSVQENLKFPPQLVSRFDLIIPFIENVQTNYKNLVDHVENRSHAKEMSSRDDRFFDTSQSSSTLTNPPHWLKFDPTEKFEPITQKSMKQYIEYVRQTFHPKLSMEARNEIHEFYREFSVLCRGHDVLNNCGTARFIESLIRLTLSRARAEMTEQATIEHAKDALRLVKYTLIDIYGEYLDETQTMDQTQNDSQFGSIRRKKMSEAVSTLSKPKQMKAYMDLLSDKCEDEDRNIFSQTEMRNYAKDLGIKEYEDVMFRLNNEGSILKTNEGYRIVRI